MNERYCWKELWKCRRGVKNTPITHDAKIYFDFRKWSIPAARAGSVVIPRVTSFRRQAVHALYTKKKEIKISSTLHQRA